MPLPVSTVAASIAIDSTPDVTSAEANFKVACHVSNLPTMATEDLTEKRMLLSFGVTVKTGACARLPGGIKAKASRPRTTDRMVFECGMFGVVLSTIIKVEDVSLFETREVCGGTKGKARKLKDYAE